ncbi:hypothetical protein EV141_0756 [Microcella putealis]|uniref:Uncharacterized protein n=2 Tax=Microcella putealis TaxID=337005 RepID=A0A4Q7LYI2_9MICO|nr:hypothetical protein EV141_0756 [Microcella putealis]TQM26640.1 hypothetical protein BJ957_0052 [Microcella putealis]
MHADDRAALAVAVARLTQAAHPHDHFGTTIGARRSLGFIPRKQTYRRAGVGWRLGVVAVDTDARLYVVGQIVRATRQVLPGHQAESARERRAMKEQLVDVGFPDGATVLLDATPVASGAAEAAGLVVVRDGRILIRWMPSAPDSALMPLPAYLAERTELALRPADAVLTDDASGGAA